MLCRRKTDGQGSTKMSKSKKARPEIIHIRKPSLSHSVSSADSAVSTATSSTFGHRHQHPIDYDPLHLHPTFAPPRRLSERPFIVSEDDMETFSSHDVEDQVLEHYKRESTKSDETDSPTPLQPTNHPRHQGSHDHSPSKHDEGGDYFMYKLHLLEHQERQQRAALDAMAENSPTSATSRPSLPRSRWSESTIATIDSSAIADDDDDDEEHVQEQDEDTDAATSDDESVLEMAMPERQVNKAKSWQNFSYKRDTAVAPASPRRPPMKTMDSVEVFIKRGGWKRRGIVFNQEEDPSNSNLF